jgi:hypothetical protein
MSVPMSEIGILKPLWSRTDDGRWGINSLKGIMLKPQPSFDANYFKFVSDFGLLTTTPPKNIHDACSALGTTDFFVQQSILPVIAWVDGEVSFRCIGTAFLISCTGYLMTACHVITDPEESGYGKVSRTDDGKALMHGLRMGVLIPISPAYGQRGHRFFEFEESWYWREWKDSPLIHMPAEFEMATDIAICKIAEMPHGAAHQPLTLSLNSFAKGERAHAIGYANIEDVPIEIIDGEPVPKFSGIDLYVSVGEVMNVFPNNHGDNKEVRTPGPCFDFNARIPGKMSGSPIFGGEGAVVRGVVSGSFSGEPHAYGAMLGPTIHLPLAETRTLKGMMDSGSEGMAKLHGQGL